MNVPPDSHGTGVPGLDRVLQRILPGDNIVWQIDDVGDYQAFVEPFCEAALRSGKKLVYFRFARHAELVPPGLGAEVRRLYPEVGFETFTAQIHEVIERAGRGAYYVFDCLSDLAADWYSDLMLGNFFMVTCPYLYELETVTYFALLRDCHSFDAVAAIRDTTQVLLDVFRVRGELYIHPLKVQDRHSPTMYFPHESEGEEFRAVTESAVLSEILAEMTRGRVDAVSRTLDIWDRKFLQAREVIEDVKTGVLALADEDEVFRRLLRMMVSRDERVVRLAVRYLSLPDLLAVRRRMIGTGLIGGKSVGMLLARAILQRDPRWGELLEAHDSFYIGADVFYTFLVRNGCWHIRRNQRVAQNYLEGAEEARARILAGEFPPFIREQFLAMLEYFGQSPIIVRSSSLLEDSFGNAFTGKYDSVFCPNQGSPGDRLASFLDAVRTIYASTMGREALEYRAHRGLLDGDEQMAILVQRVSGAIHGDHYFPHVAGVGLSYNPYVWSEFIEPEAGMIRLVFGLGTRAVDRADDDYTRVVALNAPLRRPEKNIDEVVEYAQRRADVLDLSRNRFASVPVDEILRESRDLPVEFFASRRKVPAVRTGEGRGTPRETWFLTFERLFSTTSFVDDLRRMMRTLREAYEYHVDIEFTANFRHDGSYRLHLVQCRPLQVKEGGNIVPVPGDLLPEEIVLDARGAVVGQSSFTPVDQVIYVVPGEYAKLPGKDRYSVARVIGRVTRAERERARGKVVLLLGPGRWGTSTPSLGVPVSFAEINTVSVLCEIVGLGLDVVPDVSLGTHFFNDLVEANMLYLAVFPGTKGNTLDEGFFRQGENRLAELVPDDAEWSRVIRVIDVPSGTGGRPLYLNANCLSQRAVCYLGR